MNFKTKMSELNMYHDVFFSMTELENSLKEVLNKQTNSRWLIKNKLIYDNKNKIAKIDYYVVNDKVPNIIRHIFKIGGLNFIIKGITDEHNRIKEYITKYPTKYQKELYYEMEMWFNKIIANGLAFHLGTKQIQVQNQREAYLLLYFDHLNEYNYLSTTKAFFDYPEQFDYITNPIIKLAESKKRNQQKKLTK